MLIFLPRPPLPLRQRYIYVAGATLALWLLLWWQSSPSERWHALLVPVWLLNLWLSGGKVGKAIVIWGAGLALGLAGSLWLSGSMQAEQVGGHLTINELWQKLYFTAGLFVLYNALCATLNALLSLSTKARELLKAPRGWWLRTLRVGLALIIFSPYLYTTFNLHRFKYANSRNPQLTCGLKYQDINFRAADGVNLRGWWIPSGRKTIVVVHGVGSNRGDALVVAPFLHRAGYNVFLFDLRAHGDSSGHTTTFGVQEALDVRAAVGYAAKISDSVGLYAFSMGASSAIHAFAKPGLPEVKAVVLDSTFAEFAPLARTQMAFLSDNAARPLIKLLSFYTYLEIGTTLENIAPRRYIGNIAPRPLLLIHGTADELIAPEQAKWNFAAAREPKEIYWIDGAAHCAGLAVDGVKYEKRVTEFFKRNL